MEGRGREELSCDTGESDQGGLAIWLELEAKEACSSRPPPPCGPGGPRDPHTDKHGHRDMQTAPHSDTHDRHRPVVPNMDRWGHRAGTHSHQDTESQVGAVTGG